MVAGLRASPTRFVDYRIGAACPAYPTIVGGPGVHRAYECWAGRARTVGGCHSDRRWHGPAHPIQTDPTARACPILAGRPARTGGGGLSGRPYRVRPGMAPGRGGDMLRGGRPVEGAPAPAETGSRPTSGTLYTCPGCCDWTSSLRWRCRQLTSNTPVTWSVPARTLGQMRCGPGTGCRNCCCATASSTQMGVPGSTPTRRGCAGNGSPRRPRRRRSTPTTTRSWQSRPVAIARELAGWCWLLAVLDP